MRIVMLGAPGSGKGTQAKLISEFLGIPSVSTGEIFRDNIRRKTELGIKIQKIIDAGDLAPDELTVEIVKNRIRESDCARGCLLDGFPRNVAQAAALETFYAPDIVIELDIPFDLIEKRITGRRNCAKCKGSYHIDAIGNRNDCPACGGELVVRADDNETSVKERLKVYREQTEPLTEYYAKLGKLKKIQADAPIKEVFENIKKVL